LWIEWGQGLRENAGMSATQIKLLRKEKEGEKNLWNIKGHPIA
jgi:hypothetical protein